MTDPTTTGDQLADDIMFVIRALARKALRRVADDAGLERLEHDAWTVRLVSGSVYELRWRDGGDVFAAVEADTVALGVAARRSLAEARAQARARRN